MNLNWLEEIQKLNSKDTVYVATELRHRSDATSHSQTAGTCMPCTREFIRTRVSLVCEFARTRISLAREYSRLASALLASTRVIL